MKPYVYIGRQITKEAEAFISEHCDYNIWRDTAKIPRETLKDELKEADGAIIPKVPVNQELLQDAKNLKVISNVAVGYDNFDIEALKEAGVIGTHTPYVLDETVADLVFNLILSGARRTAELQQFTREGKWNKMDDPYFLSKDVHHSKLGVIGMGRIGEKICRRANLGFEMEVMYYNRSRNQKVEEEYEARKVSLDVLLEQSDIIVIMLPLNEKTRHFIGEQEIQKMNENTLLVNASRGPIIDEEALIKALENKHIYGAALDVFENEPLASDSPLLQLSNATITPHVGSATKQTRDAMDLRAAKNLVNGVLGHGPVDIIKELQ